MHQQEKAIKFLTTHRKYRILWWGFGPSLLEDLCKEKKFDVKEFLNKKDQKQCTELLEAFGERKVYWWWPWSGKVKDIVIDNKDYKRAKEYKNYSWLWKIILGLFTSVLVHRQILKWDSIFVSYGGYMHRRAQDLERARSLNIPDSVVDLNGKFETIGDTLNSLGFAGLLKQLDNSLEMVRRNVESREGHEQFVKELDKKMQKLSLQVHPDRVKNRGGSEEEIAKAQEKQAALTASRTVIKSISEHFLDSIYIDYRYEFYSKMKISSLGDTRVLNRLEFKMLMELSILSDIKQEEIIGNMNKFLKASNASMERFIHGYCEEGNEEAERDFKKNSKNALLYLNMCIRGYEKLNSQLGGIRAECQGDEELKSLLYDSICNMSEKSAEHLRELKKIEIFTRASLEGKFRVLDIENLDDYFVLPFATYISIFLICSMSKKSFNLQSSSRNLLSYIVPEFLSKKEEQHSLYSAYYLMLYLNGNGKHEKEVRNILGITENKSIEYNYVKNNFISIIIEVTNNLAQRFKPENYIERGTPGEHRKNLRELKKRVDDFINRMQEDLKQAQNIREEREKNWEKLENLERMMTDYEKQRKKRTKVQGSLAEQSSNPSNEIESISRKQLSSLSPEDSSNNSLQAQPVFCSQLLSSSNHQQQAYDSQVTQSVSQPNSELSKVQPILRCRSSSLSNSDEKNGNQPGPSGKLSEVQSISRSQSLNSLHSSDNDIEIISKSQFR